MASLLTAPEQVPSPPSRRGKYVPKHAKAKPRHRVRNSALVLLTVLAVLAGWFAYSVTQTAAATPGAPIEVVIATWARDHGLAPVLARAEEAYYSTIAKPEEGGSPTVSMDVALDDTEVEVVTEPVAPVDEPSTVAAAPEERAHLAPPAALELPVGDPLPKEGVWQPVGDQVDGIPAMYSTRLRPDATHTSVVMSMLWVDPLLTHVMFVPGTTEPGGPNPYNGGLPKDQWDSLLANWNGGFRLDDSYGGYVYDDTVVKPLSDGQASAVFYRDGTMDIVKWGRDVKRTGREILAVRQNMELIIDKGKSQVADSDIWWKWGGPSVRGATLTWRSAVGVREDGSIVYAAGPSLSASALADALTRAGVQRAMVLDMNGWWSAGYTFKHNDKGALVCKKIQPEMPNECHRFLDGFMRDSFQILSRPEPASASAAQ